MIEFLEKALRQRVINIPDDRKQLWQQIESVLRNPVIRKFVLRKDMKLERKQVFQLYVSIHFCSIMFI